MASEHAHKIDGAVRKLRAVMEAFDMKGTNRATMLNAINTIEALRTRPAPAATDTGLVTVAWQRHSSFYADGWGPVDAGHAQKLAAAGEPVRELVTRSQAEELLAAERAEKEEWKGRATDRGLEAEKWFRLYGDLKADNAAQAARIKELDHENNCWMKSAIKQQKRSKALEAKLAAAQKALEPFAKIPVSDVPEGRLGHVPDKHPYMVDIEGNILFTASDIRKARAVMGVES
ncbi:hypothetical protein BiPBO1_47 [Brucella phage BiPBO1]|uniref:hypothetical protein n=1 Tax=Brucella phage BiPBO1 TaxID=1718278 RepID=UPI00046D62EE|nr:hypothetical protein [Brucella inopinata]YP_009304075.1 hypothetical protein BJD47_gp47 [Brucella phage BiPBO1]ALJ98261.1 hypothetical protein BiPBO1_47 [Brucella phage BiPBO1]KEY03797.1 hypothetical protein IL59_0214325 [Brucella suis bv. 4 str. 40]